MGAKANLNSKHKKGKPSEKGGGNGRVVEDEEGNLFEKKPEGEGKSMKQMWNETDEEGGGKVKGFNTY